MKELRVLLDSFFRSQLLGDSKLDLYRKFKPYLIEAGYYPKAYLQNENFYFQFQKNIQEMASLPYGINLALAMMVEINVSGGVLWKANSLRAMELRSRLFQPGYIIALGVSEPGWGGSLKKLKSCFDANLKLTGVKSFISNGGSANIILWLVPINGVYSVYALDRNKYRECLHEVLVPTDFAKGVSHLRMEVSDYPMLNEDLVLEDYGDLGIEIRLKEMFSLVSLFLGFTKLHYGELNIFSFEKTWQQLENWKIKLSKKIINANFFEVLENEFPFPIDDLLLLLARYEGIENINDLRKIRADFVLFVWKDQLTKYLARKKYRRRELI